MVAVASAPANSAPPNGKQDLFEIGRVTGQAEARMPKRGLKSQPGKLFRVEVWTRRVTIDLCSAVAQLARALQAALGMLSSWAYRELPDRKSACAEVPRGNSRPRLTGALQRMAPRHGDGRDNERASPRDSYSRRARGALAKPPARLWTDVAVRRRRGCGVASVRRPSRRSAPADRCLGGVDFGVLVRRPQGR